MNDSQTPEFETDNGFLELIQPRDEKYIEELEEDIFDHGCHDAVCVWGNILIDGHLRYSICKKWDIRFNIRRLIFQSRDEAEVYLCAEQLKRTDLTSEYKKYLIGRLFRADMNAASTAFLREHPEKQTNADGQISQKYVQKTEIATIIGKEYNFGFSTVTKYDVYARALDEIRAKGPEITNKILNGNLRVSHENVIELSRLPIEDINGLKRLLESGSIDRIGYSQLRHELRWQRLPTGKPDYRRRRREREFQIRIFIFYISFNLFQIFHCDRCINFHLTNMVMRSCYYQSDIFFIGSFYHSHGLFHISGAIINSGKYMTMYIRHFHNLNFPSYGIQTSADRQSSVPESHSYSLYLFPLLLHYYHRN